ncbi:hypothetical protein [Sandarakinorhabdus sp.]|uniref:hypothetical protein n=1 Tax=Sandarakinorhabdus sp. TaxID=1916663 RepID=UPI00286E272B|nr:hypothetical protein [Sandarakinorhabdus sp.]
MSARGFSLAGLLLLGAAPAQAGPFSRWFDCYAKLESPKGALPAADTPPPQDPALAPIAGRRTPGFGKTTWDPVVQANAGAVSPPVSGDFPTDHLPVPDRWRLVETLGLVKSNWKDPYNQNTLKGDRPLCGTDDLFLQLTAISDTVAEPRSFPTPVGVQTTERPGSNDVFGRPHSTVFAQTFILGAALTKGSTAFKPPEYELRAAIAFNFNHVDVSERRVLSVESSRRSFRSDAFVGVQELFLDYHLRNTSDRYDFDSVRVGIQPFSSDFRGFLFQDNQLGIRLFGNRDNNRFQYNLAAFWRLEKDSNSGLNAVLRSPRKDLVLVANLYRQDFPVPGLTSQVSVLYNRNREKNDVQIDTNGFPVRPALLGSLRGRNYDVAYLSYNADGRIGRLNLTVSGSYALGTNSGNIFTDRRAKIRSFFLAAEPSYDRGWVRFRGSVLYASGDSNPFDDTDRGYAAVFENPQFAGADTSYWIRQAIPFAGGGRAITVNSRNGILNDLRSSKDQGQSNFSNPGTVLLGVGADLDLLPELRLSASANHLWFAHTAVLEALRSEGSVPSDIGFDLSAAATYRPHFNQNLVFRLSGAVLLPGAGFRDLFANAPRASRYYSVLFNAVLAY